MGKLEAALWYIGGEGGDEAFESVGVQHAYAEAVKTWPNPATAAVGI